MRMEELLVAVGLWRAVQGQDETAFNRERGAPSSCGEQFGNLQMWLVNCQNGQTLKRCIFKALLQHDDQL